MVQFYRQSKSTHRSKNNTKQVLIDAVNINGEGVVSTVSPVMYVSGALPGETHTVAVETKNNHYQSAVTCTKPFEIGNPNSQRTKPFCSHVVRCGGCTTQNCEPEAMLHHKKLALDKLIKQRLNLDYVPWGEVIRSDERAYRRKSRFALDARNKEKLKFGFRAAKSKTVVDIDCCPILTQPLQKLQPLLKKALIEMSDKGMNLKAIGHITLLECEQGISLGVNYVRPPNDKTVGLWQKVVNDWSKSFGRVDLDIMVQNQTVQRVTEGDKPPLALCAGEHGRLYPSVNDFIQVNETVNRQMIARVIRLMELSPTDHVAEFFAGLGNFTYDIAHRVASVSAYEGNLDMVSKASEQMSGNAISNVQWFETDLSLDKSLLKLDLSRVNKVLLDPSRNGAFELCQLLASSDQEIIVYVSCNAKTWIRDAKLLLQGNYKLDNIIAMDMFPYTHHLELLSVFVRK